MTQRIFDVENEKDMHDLWDILPSCINCINKRESFLYIKNKIKLIHINWHDKTEITRPIQEATKSDIDKLCYFWDGIDDCEGYGILSTILAGSGVKYGTKSGYYYRHARRLTKQEIEELC